MGTRLTVDDHVLADAMKHAAGRTRKEVVHDALREYARRREVAELLQFRGKVKWEGAPGASRGRRGRT